MKFYTLLAFSILLSACSAGNYKPPAPDPYRERDLLDADIRATERAKIEQSAQETAQAAKDEKRTKNEIERIMAPVTAEAARLNLQITAGAATQTAAVATDSAIATRAAGTATQAVADYQLAEKKRDDARNNAISIAWNIGYFAFVIVIVTAGMYGARWVIMKLTNEKIKRDQEDHLLEEQKKRLLYPGDNIICYLPADGGPPVQVFGPKDFLPTTSTVPYSVAGTPFDPMRGDGNGNAVKYDTQSLAIQLVNQSIVKFGENSDHLAGWRLMNWTPSKWQRIMRSIAADGLCETVTDPADGRKKVVLVEEEQGGYRNLRAFRDALIDGSLELRPAPPSLPYSEIVE